MASNVAICNRALQRLGAKRITSLTENSVNARTMNVAFEPVRDALLEKYPWRFAIKRTQLAASATTPDFGKARAFPLPSDFIRLHTPYPETNYNDRDWEIEGNEILTHDSAPLDIRYIALITDPNEMTPLFREALSLSLAEEICEEITQSNTKLVNITAARKLIIREARASNAFQTIANEAPDDTWITVRS